MGFLQTKPQNRICVTLHVNVRPKDKIESFLRQLTAEAWLPDAVADFLSGSEGVISVAMVGLTLVLLMLFRPQGITGNRIEMQLDAR